MAIEVRSPRRDFTGVVGKVAFVDGRAVVDEDEHAAALAYFRRRGYQVGNLDEDPDTESPGGDNTEHSETDADGEEPDHSGMPHGNASRGTWAEFAEAQGVETEGLSKAKIIEAVKAAMK